MNNDKNSIEIGNGIGFLPEMKITYNNNLSGLIDLKIEKLLIENKKLYLYKNDSYSALWTIPVDENNINYVSSYILKYKTNEKEFKITFTYNFEEEGSYEKCCNLVDEFVAGVKEIEKNQKEDKEKEQKEEHEEYEENHEETEYMDEWKNHIFNYGDMINEEKRLYKGLLENMIDNDLEYVSYCSIFAIDLNKIDFQLADDNITFNLNPDSELYSILGTPFLEIDYYTKCLLNVCDKFEEIIKYKIIRGRYLIIDTKNKRFV